MARYRRQQTIFDNLRETRAKMIQQTSPALGSSSIDWDDDGDDGESLDITVNDSTVARYGHWGDAHGFLVIGGGTGWRTVQDDAQVRANAAEADAKAHADALDAATRAWVNGQVNGLSNSIGDLAGLIGDLDTAVNSLKTRMTNLESRVSTLEGLG